MSWTEDTLIAAMRDVLPVGRRTLVGSGDDCAVIAAPEKSYLVTTDILVDGRHFNRAWSAPSQIGRRAAAQNLADIAGQGGIPTGLVVSLVVPSDLDIDWLIDVVRGFGAEVEPTGAGVVGGDLSSGDLFVISVTAFGYAPYGSVLRSGAQPGDVIAVAGTLGFSAAGWELLDQGVAPSHLHTAEELGCWYPMVSVFRHPRPPLAAGVAAARHGAHAMMDVSDGLSTDLARMARSSRVNMDLHSNLLQHFVVPLEEAAQITDSDPWDWILNGGEDHAMVACFPADTVLPQPFKEIGTVSVLGEGYEPLVRFDGRTMTSGGWDHFTRTR
ncbi:MAG: thiamine-phosphate kinase [Actinomycetaceae bacterium]|nr:thiamine-phosphate kinase [Actinomycetaceae bacterium]